MARKRRRSSRKRKSDFGKVSIAIIILIGSFLIFVRAFISLISPVFNNDNNEVVVEQQHESMSHEEFIQFLQPHAKALQAEYGILPSIILGQAILESDWGKSQLASEYYNLFGIKASEGTPKVTLETMEFVNQKWITIQGDFRVYNSWEESMREHTLLFVNGVSWDPNLYAGVLVAENYQQAAIALQEAGYATDPDYSTKIIQVIESHQLNQYD
ncbi:flagellum-specific peptidoglycan hydrolase FlgJ [Enterococcus sp. PF1-24]|uniref:glycoside hydrolase family 73 protein n=1 Tax=unclassified Enterococcus TaxID=2608891 RepID=UPI0024769857|nr:MULTISPECIES: glycoside hydrolase family 73 protein [unclassified Enterococcus]MDH6365193.1 flagellum-specific peptidoglycan hydrolase FlgJ [Enterococcus sp. PFB1-1]MDH6402294.1 flagellum-specific peptidoglycan hydrolase FlgJ [Enterococcus sp. PF1-24]